MLKTNTVATVLQDFFCQAGPHEQKHKTSNKESAEKTGENKNRPGIVLCVAGGSNKVRQELEQCLVGDRHTNAGKNVWDVWECVIVHRSWK